MFPLLFLGSLFSGMDAARVLEPAQNWVLAHQVHNETVQAHLTLAEKLASEGRPDESIKELLRARKLDPQADVSPALARMYAVQNYRKALDVDPKYKTGWLNLGLALGQQGKYEDSLAAFEKAVRPAEARCNLAFVLCTQRKFDQARKLYQEALEMDPSLTLARKGLNRLKSDGQ